MDEIRTRLTVAEAAARRAGEVLLEHFRRGVRYDRKGDVDLVSEADRASEAVVADAIHAAFADDALLLEESGAIDGAAERAGRFRWVVDPLDGTTNFVHGHPAWAVSIALEASGGLVGGVVHAPVSGETFTALRGGGARRNDVPIHVSSVEALRGALVGTGFPYDRQRRPEDFLARLADFLRVGQGVRRCGSASLDLCFVAAGRLDVFYEEGLKAWDVAAGVLLVEEAGGRVSRYDGSPMGLHDEEILASNGTLHEAAIATLAGL